MPGIQMTVFRGQVEQLMLAFTRPTDFLRQLRAIFERYGLPAYRPSDEKQNIPEPAYHLPALVIREIEIKLPPLCQNNPGAALRLSEALAADRYAEVRLLAGDVLGFTPATEAEAIMAAISRFCDNEESILMQRQFVNRGSLSLRRTAGTKWLEWIEEHLLSTATRVRSIGYIALFPLIEDNEFENIPPVFRLLEPRLLTAKRDEENLLRALVKALANRTPIETAYFLSEIAPYAEEERSQRLIRSCVPFFDMEQQRLIRGGLAESRKLQ